MLSSTQYSIRREMWERHSVWTLWPLAVTLSLLLTSSSVFATPPIGTGDTVEFADAGQSLGSVTANDVALGDLDGDGDLDAFVAHPSTLANTVWMNNGSGAFADNGQSLGSARSREVALGDMDGDGDLDAVVANYAGEANTVWLNNGSGVFTDSGQSLGSGNSYDVALGDLDGDGDLDAFVANTTSEANTVWWNNGSGVFTDSGQSLGSANSNGVALRDLDGDGDLDALVANLGEANTVWQNNGSGVFKDSRQGLGSANSRGVALGDVDDDGDLDAYVANLAEANTVWLNDGSGVFYDSRLSLGSAASMDVTLGDVDGDGDLDAFVINYNGVRKVWMNDGSGVFTDSGQNPGPALSMSVALGDVDGDGDLDALVANWGQANKVWLNNGSGVFTISSQDLGSSNSRGIALGDMDGDGDLDAFVANFAQAHKTWQNNGSGVFTDSGQNPNSADSRGVALGDVDGDGDLDAFIVNNYGDADKVWRNEGGSAGFTVTSTAPSSFANNSEEDIFEVTFAHNGIAGDRDLEMSIWDVNLLRTDCTTALTSAEANAMIANLRLRLDDGDGIFESDGSDVLVADVDTLDLTDGVQQVSFTNDDANVQVAAITTKHYWLSVLTTADASAQSPNNFCLSLDPDAQMLVEGKTPDFSVSIQDSQAINSYTAPLAVTLGSFRTEQQDETIDVHWQTVSESGTAGFTLLALIDGESIRLHDDLIPSPVIDSVTPTDYQFSFNLPTLVEQALPDGYQLETVIESMGFILQEHGIDGGVVEHGPFEQGDQYGVFAGSNDGVRPKAWLPVIAGP